MFSNGKTAMLFSNAGACADTGAGLRRSRTRRVITMRSTPMMRKSSLRLVLRAIDSWGATSSVRFKPSGVSSKIQASTSATGKPRMRQRITKRTAHAGMEKTGKICVAIWMTSHDTTA